MSESDAEVNLAVHKNAKYSLHDKNEVAKVALKNKAAWEAETERLKNLGKVYKKGKWVVQIPKEGYLAKTVRDIYPELKNATNRDPRFQAAKQMVLRALQVSLKRKADPANVVLEAADVRPSKKRFRADGAGEFILVFIFFFFNSIIFYQCFTIFDLIIIISNVKYPQEIPLLLILHEHWQATCFIPYFNQPC